jgi:hypothetical protein
MSIPTEEAEGWALACDFCRLPIVAATLRSLAAERDALRAAVQTARRDALEEAAKWHDEQAKLWQNTYAKESLSAPDMQTARIQCLERYGFHIIAAADIRTLGEKE